MKVVGGHLIARHFWALRHGARNEKCARLVGGRESIAGLGVARCRLGPAESRARARHRASHNYRWRGLRATHLSNCVRGVATHRHLQPARICSSARFPRECADTIVSARPDHRARRDKNGDKLVFHRHFVTSLGTACIFTPTPGYANVPVPRASKNANISDSVTPHGGKQH